MSEGIMIMMIGVSTLLGALGLLGLIWAIKTGQFDDHSKFIDGAHHDNEEDLRDAVQMEEKQKAYKKQQEYRPPE
jgi:cbb3-type cytochrome oxidase maturation protein